jgi:hypothetical protein
MLAERRVNPNRPFLRTAQHPGQAGLNLAVGISAMTLTERLRCMTLATAHPKGNTQATPNRKRRLHKCRRFYCTPSC